MIRLRLFFLNCFCNNIILNILFNVDENFIIIIVIDILMLKIDVH
jgi:hypothetical protein